MPNLTSWDCHEWTLGRAVRKNGRIRGEGRKNYIKKGTFGIVSGISEKSNCGMIITITWFPRPPIYRDEEGEMFIDCEPQQHHYDFAPSDDSIQFLETTPWKGWK